MYKTVGVMGPSGKLTITQRRDAFGVGQMVARRGFALITGGLGGVMEAASASAKSEGGLVIGICPIGEKKLVNSFVDVAIMTDMGGGRNYMNILSSDAVIAIGCNRSAGTLSEIAFALQSAKPLMILRPPEKMQIFLESFAAPGRAAFGSSLEDVDEFLGRVSAGFKAGEVKGYCQ